MNMVREFDRIFLDGISQSRDIKSEPLILGGFLNYLNFVSRDTVSHPLYFNLQQKDDSHSFYFAQADRWNIQFVKRLKKSPFYISYLTTDHQTLQIIDFFSWTSEYTFYRILKLSDSQANRKKSLKGPQPVSGKISGCSYISAGISVTESENQLEFNSKSEISYIVFRESGFSISEVNNLDVLKKLKQQSTLYDENNISRMFATNSIEYQQKIEKTWFTQRVIRGDLSVDPHLLDRMDKYGSDITSVILLARYLNLTGVLTQIYDILCISPKNSRTVFLKAWLAQELHGILINPEKIALNNTGIDVFDAVLKNIAEPNISAEKFTDLEFPYVAFFAGSFSDEHIVERLHHWWDIISLPVMEYKFQHTLSENPESMLLYALLALKYRTAWSGFFISKCNNFNKCAMFSLLISLNQIIVKTYASNGKFQVSAGPMITSNKNTLHQNSEKITYTTFGKKNYVSIYTDNKNILKFDRHWSVVLNPKNERFDLKPLITGMRYPDRSYVQLEINQKTAHIPLVLAAGDLQFMGVRCRWLLKKNRFQLTFSQKRLNQPVTFNGSLLNFNGKDKIVMYHVPGKQNPLILCHLLDSYGRRFHFQERSHRNSILLHGFAQDHHGILVKSLNIVETSRQKVLRSGPSGHISGIVGLRPDQKNIKLQIKRFAQIIKLKEYAGHATEALLKFSPSLSKSSFIVLIEDSVSQYLDQIRNFFYCQFGFEPVYVNQYNIEKRITCAVMINITRDKKKFVEIVNPALNQHPYLSVGIKYLLDKNLPDTLLAEVLDS
jgi:hypothetical protein